jgi:hypothetical protein
MAGSTTLLLPSNNAAANYVISPPGPLALAWSASERAPPVDTNGKLGIDESARRLLRKRKFTATGKVHKDAAT